MSYRDRARASNWVRNGVPYYEGKRRGITRTRPSPLDVPYNRKSTPKHLRPRGRPAVRVNRAIRYIVLDLEKGNDWVRSKFEGASERRRLGVRYREYREWHPIVTAAVRAGLLELL